MAESGSALADTIAAQRRAAEPTASAWVSANAGAGKTHVLVMRLLRLLLAGTPPERILCLTFTKAAAAEMATRVLGRLSTWVTGDEAALQADLYDLFGRAPLPEELERARDLFAIAMEAPGGLKVQTIHAFCERLLQRFPLEAGVPPHFTILDDDTKRRLLREATDQVLMTAVSTPDSELATAHRRAIAFAAEDGFDSVLAEALRRPDLLDAVRHEGPDLLDDILRDALGVRRRVTSAALESELDALIEQRLLASVRDVLIGGKTSDIATAAAIGNVLAAQSRAGRIEAMSAFCHTGEGELRQRLMTKALAGANTALHQALVDLQRTFCRLYTERVALVVVEATMALVVLSGAIAQRYADLKHGRAALDFDDLIRRTASLLADSEAADWVLYKLDGGLDHILVDEAQDTSPQQWTLIEALAREFHAGVGVRDAGTPDRTVFAVGDNKQSIYGFQGAEPHLFAAKGAALQSVARLADHAWHEIPLTLSFRSVAPVLAAVDCVFADPLRTRGVSPARGASNVVHLSNRPGMAGLVELWETEKPELSSPRDVWAPAPVAPPSQAADRLAGRIAETIAGWLATGERLESEGRRIRAGDILILVRRRRPFADCMVAALEAANVPVAGADRIRLTDQLAVEDLLVLGRFLLLPEDDLALATVLEGPMFGLSDDDLLAIAPERRGSLWSALLRAAQHDGRFVEPAERLKRWRNRADQVPPFEFFIEVLDHDGMRRRLLTRLGAEAADAIDEFLTLAMAYDETAAPSMQGFVHWMSNAQNEIKRDMEQGRDEVRVMTVHGAKGLEAPIVFLPDTCSAASNARSGGLLPLTRAVRPIGIPEPFVWPVRGSKNLCAVKAAREGARERETEEHHRLLYVAMTRARDRLYVAGFEGVRRGRDCWYQLVEETSGGRLIATVDAAGRPVRRLSGAQTMPAETERDAGHAAPTALVPPDWARRRAPAEPIRLVPLVPSRLAPLDADAQGEPIDRPRAATGEPAALPPAARSADNRFLRGTLTHALLQHLPDIPLQDRSTAARGFVELRGGVLSPTTRMNIVEETLAILSDPTFRALFEGSSRAEVPVVADIAPPEGVDGARLRITGQIDRLVQLADRVLIVDYKTNRPPPTVLDGVPEAYLLQLAAYRLAVGRIFAPLPVQAALLWTDGPRLMQVPSHLLDQAEKRLFQPSDMDGT